ncbi:MULTISPECIES: PsiF family protein [Pseudomonas]|uniref:Phosphate starvation-inducible protein PsiF n=1 Tax=Pseudomonas multiresinivorans TaxID=95301 RepID=A0A7Z3GSN2_9PSED|nr:MULTISPECIES: PsiF family protein [Pseudomonas]MCE4071585.1 PsiF family protein [Pseudomonas nitritireducens]MCE4081361.1 PsiF family protein [Pseudomonas nitroreducens]OBY89324.1 phosphate starvation-inducible protein PsiF [Pseudomonas sp. AU11447]QJP11281.1 phosphate starvation-inducible protein PsiF [Pseudomonas multiresinivorans]
MTTVRIPLLVLALLFSAQGFAATAAQTAQQEKMKSCNADATAKTLKGDERKAYMSTCLKAGGGDAKKMTPQQEKMKTCNADATTKALKGDERKAFMSTCLKK